MLTYLVRLAQTQRTQPTTWKEKKTNDKHRKERKEENTKGRNKKRNSKKRGTNTPGKYDKEQGKIKEGKTKYPDPEAKWAQYAAWSCPPRRRNDKKQK